MKRAVRRVILSLPLLMFFFVAAQNVNQMEKNMEVSKNGGIKLFLAGDVMTGRGIDQALPYSVSPVLYENYVKDARDYLKIAERKNGSIKTPVPYDYIWGDALKVWQNEDPDLKLVNLETSITTHDKPWTGKGIHYRMHPENVQLLSVGGINHVSLANNHILDWSRPGLEQTIKSLKNAGISFSGAGMNINDALEPSVFYVDNKRILVFSYGAGNSGIPSSWVASKTESGVNYIHGFGKNEIEEIKNHILSSKKTDDLVIFSIHWGGNWGYNIPQDHRSFAHKLIDEAGVDLIFGHSSHHPMGIEVYKNKLIIYGAGDFINDYEGIRGHEEYRSELSLMYFSFLDPGSGNLKSLKMVPMETRKFSLRKARKDRFVWLKNNLSKYGKDLGTTIKREEGNSLWLDWQ